MLNIFTTIFIKHFEPAHNFEWDVDVFRRLLLGYENLRDLINQMNE